jgi:two-component system, OmpR family, sensor histidine kinase KdpD
MKLSLPLGTARVQRWPAALAWALGWAAMFAFDGHVDLANLAMLLVLASALASLWLPAGLSALASALAVLAFNWCFVPPRGSFTVDLQAHALLLGALLAVNWIVAMLMAALRRQAEQAQHQAERAEQLRDWGDTLRDAVDPLAHGGALQQALAGLAGVPVAVLMLSDAVPPTDDDSATLRAGDADADQQAGLWLCLRQGQPMGPGTGRHDALPDWYLPLRGRHGSLGAAVLIGLGPQRAGAELRVHAQALCDQMGQALERARLAREQQRTQAQAQQQSVRNALLAAISHDYRTPLATILGAASALDEQAERLNPEQRRRLARSIVDEVRQLGRLTDNTLQLARLDAPGVELRCDWESAEEIVGAALRHARQRDASRRVRARVEPGLPLLWCDAMLMSQLLDNLVDNALKYSPAEAPIEILVRRCDDAVLLAVRDRGPGVAPAARERIFEVFQRSGAPIESLSGRPGAGVGLAVCRAIAQAHGGTLRLRARGHGGCSFECALPLRAQPAQPTEPAPATEERSTKVVR